MRIVRQSDVDLKNMLVEKIRPLKQKEVSLVPGCDPKVIFRHLKFALSGKKIQISAKRRKQL